MEAVPKDWGQTQRPQRDRKENIIKPWMSDLEFRTYGEKKKKRIQKHKKLLHAGLGGSLSHAPLSPVPTAFGDATATLRGGSRRTLRGGVVAVNRSDQRHYRFLLCGAVIRWSWGGGCWAASAGK